MTALPTGGSTLTIQLQGFKTFSNECLCICDGPAKHKDWLHISDEVAARQAAKRLNAHRRTTLAHARIGDVAKCAQPPVDDGPRLSSLPVGRPSPAGSAAVALWCFARHAASGRHASMALRCAWRRERRALASEQQPPPARPRHVSCGMACRRITDTAVSEQAPFLPRSLQGIGRT